MSLIEPLPRTIILQPVSCSNCLAVIPRGPKILPTKLNWKENTKKRTKTHKYKYKKIWLSELLIFMYLFNNLHIQLWGLFYFKYLQNIFIEWFIKQERGFTSPQRLGGMLAAKQCNYLATITTTGIQDRWVGVWLLVQANFLVSRFTIMIRCLIRYLPSPKVANGNCQINLSKLLPMLLLWLTLS